MWKQRFFELEEDPKGQFLWKQVPVEMMKSSKLKISDSVYDIGQDLKNVFTVTNGIYLEKLGNQVHLGYQPEKFNTNTRQRLY